MRVFIEGVDGYVGGAVKRLVEARFKSAQQDRGDESKGEDEAETLQVVGSVANAGVVPDGVSEAVPHGDLDKVCELARSADQVVLDTHESIMEASAVVKALKAPFSGSKSLVLISTLLTWNRTPGVKSVAEEAACEEKSGDVEDTAEPVLFREDDFTRRKPSPEFLMHKTLESQVLALAHDSLSTTVLASGIIYGAEQGLLEAVYRDAWLGRQGVLPDTNTGCKNTLPTIHVQDLAQATLSALNSPPTQQYVAVADEAHDTVADIVTSAFSVIQLHPELVMQEVTDLSAELSAEEQSERDQAWRNCPAQLRLASAEETDEILLRNEAWLQLQDNLRFDTSEGAVDSLVDEWVSREGPVANARRLADEFRAARNLRPIRLVVTGPPGSGKTNLAERVANEYYIQRIDVASATKQVLDALQNTRTEREKRLDAWKEATLKRKAEERAAELASAAEDGEASTDAAQEDLGEIELSEEDLQVPEREDILRKSAAEKLAERVEHCLEQNGGKLSNKLESKVLRAAMLSCNALNHGYVLDAEAITYGGLRRVFGMTAVTEGLWDPDQEGADEADQDQDCRDADDLVFLQNPGDGEEEDAEAEQIDPVVLDTRICPTAVIALDAQDDTLRERARAAEAQSEDEFEAALEKFRRHNADHLQRTPLSFLEGECKLESFLLPTDRDLSAESKTTGESKDAAESKEGGQDTAPFFLDFEQVRLYVEQGGRPFNYHPTEEEVLERHAQAQASQLALQEQQRKERVDTEAQRKDEEATKLKTMEQHRERVEQHEKELLEARSEPLRDFLMTHVMPTLSKGLVETCRVKPDDPVDYLAEYLFKHSAESEQKSE